MVRFDAKAIERRETFRQQLRIGVIIGQVIIITTGVLISVGLGLIYLRYPGLVGERGWPMALMTAWTACCLAMVLYLLAAAFIVMVALVLTGWAR